MKALLPFLIFLTISTSCTRHKFEKAEGMIWNTSYHFTFEGDRSLADSALVILDSVGRSLNVFDPSSTVSRVNGSSDSALVDRSFIDVYNASRLVNKLSQGAFDPTLAPLIDAWGFGKGHKATADTADVAKLLESVGIGKSYLKADTLFKKVAALNFNFSGVAKGYGCDAVARMLRRNRVSNYLIEIGGEIAVGGVSPQFDQWKISIDTPLPDNDGATRSSAAVVRVTDAGIATSGNYRNFHRDGNRKFGHTISPLTGRPVETDVISATVIAPTAMLADAAATACMASGSEIAKKVIADLKCEAYLILSDSTVWATPGLAKLLEY